MKAGPVFKFRLYVASNTPNAAKAMNNLEQFCQLHLAGRHFIDVVDVFKQPERALTDQIYMTPTLLRLAPSPLRRVVGTLSDAQSLREAIGLVTRPGMNPA